MGMIVTVFKDSDLNGDYSLDGISSRFSRFCVINVDGPFHPDDNTPPVRLVKGHNASTVHLIPTEEETKGKWVMFGGNFASTSDSRWYRAIEALIENHFYGAVAIHDRIEHF